MAKFCGKCGARLDEKTGLCSNCNASIMHKTSQKSSPSVHKVARKIRMSVVAFSFLLIALMCGIGLNYLGIIQVPFISDFLPFREVGDTSLRKNVETAIQNALSGDDSIDIIDSRGQSIDTLTGGDATQKIYEVLSFSVLETKQQENIVTATVTFVVPDILVLIEEYAGLDSRQSDFPNWLEGRLNDEFPIQEMTIPVQFIVEDKKVALVADEELYNVLIGGAMRYYAEQQRAAYETFLEGVSQ